MKNYLIIISFILIFLQFFSKSYSQGIRVDASGVAVNTDDSPSDQSAIFDVKSTTQGMLIPRVTNTQMNAISNPATGLLVYNSDQGQFYYYTGSAWKVVSTKLSTGNIPIGDTNGFLKARTISGNATIDTSGVLTIADNAVTGAKIALGSDATGDLMYYNGTDYARLPAGTSGYYLKMNGTTPTWSTELGDIQGVTAGNGLINGGTTGTVTLDINAANGLTVNADTIRLGGTLNQNTTIVQGSYSYTVNNSGTANTIFNLSSTGDFDIQDNSTSKFFVSDAGKIGINNNSSLTNQININGGINLLNDSAYWISSKPVLKIKSTGSLFVGSESGNSTTGSYNTFSGYQSGYSNTTGQDNTFTGCKAGFNNTASYNTFNGSYSGANNISGHDNTFLGYKSGDSNTTGSYNVFCGDSAGFANTSANYNTFTGYLSGKLSTANGNTFYGSRSGAKTSTGESNTFFGSNAGYNNTTAGYNVFNGYEAGYSNVSGQNNTFTGYRSGYSNTITHYNSFYGNASGFNNTGNYNTFIGYRSGYSNTTGYCNIFIGYYAGNGNTTGNNNTIIGYNANANGNYTNATAIGNGAIVTSSNHVMIGNSTVTEIGGYATWTNYSDGRFKFNIQENVKGLEFIKKLRPVTYQINTRALDDYTIQKMSDSLKTMHQNGVDFTQSTNIIHSGFIAQEVEQAERECGYTSTIVSIPTNNTEPYSLSYAEFVVPLVKAVQEQQRIIEDLQSKYDALEVKYREIETRLNNINH